MLARGSAFWGHAHFARSATPPGGEVAGSGCWIGHRACDGKQKRPEFLASDVAVAVVVGVVIVGGGGGAVAFNSAGDKLFCSIKLARIHHRARRPEQLNTAAAEFGSGEVVARVRAGAEARPGPSNLILGRLAAFGACERAPRPTMQKTATPIVHLHVGHFDSALTIQLQSGARKVPPLPATVTATTTTSANATIVRWPLPECHSSARRLQLQLAPGRPEVTAVELLACAASRHRRPRLARPSPSPALGPGASPSDCSRAGATSGDSAGPASLFRRPLVSRPSSWALARPFQRFASLGEGSRARAS